MGRLLFTFTDSISKKEKKSKAKKRHQNLPVQVLAFVFMVAAAFTYGAIVGYDYSHGTNGLASRRLYQNARMLATEGDEACMAATTVDTTTTTNSTSPTPAATAETLDIASEGGGYLFEDAFTAEERKNGAIVLHIIGICWMFLGIAIICDDFFEASLEALCEALQMNDDVAGATFMAAGGSAPELFTSIMGVFVAKSDVGFGTIVGSAVFNVLFVIACCAFACPDLPLTWWPLCRDSVYYCFSILVLTACALDQEIHWWEALLLLICYAMYVTVMAFNIPLRNWTHKHVVADETRNKANQGVTKICTKFTESTGFEIAIYIIIVANVIIVFLDTLPDKTCAQADLYVTLNLICSILFIGEMLCKMGSLGAFGYWRGTLNAFDGVLVVLIFVEWGIQLAQGTQTTTGAGAMRGVKGLRGMKVFRFLKIARCVRFIRLIKLVEKTKKTDAAVTDQDDKTSPNQVVPSTEQNEKPKEATEETAVASTDDVEKGKDVEASKEKADGEGEGGDEDSDEEDDDPPWPWPLPGSEAPEDAMGKAVAIFGFPLLFGMCMTVPHPGRKGWEKSWPGTFIMCIVWIALLSYFMVWWADLFGQVVGIPPTIMGLTLLAGGTSIPDAMSSIAVAKRGKGDMAVSSSLGSNVFDILIGLPLPWILYTGVVTLGKETVPIYSSNLTILILTLFIMVSLVITLVHWASWKLTVNLGWAMMFLYFVFLAQSLLLEYNVLSVGACPLVC